MTHPFKRFFGGIMIGTFISILFLQGQDEPIGSIILAKIQAMPAMESDPVLPASVAFLGFACAWVGAMATRKARPSFALRSTVETLRQRRQRLRGHSLLR